MQSIEVLSGIVKKYDDYFTLLSQGEPEDPKLPELTAESVAEIIMVSVDDQLSAEELNELLDGAKIGFTVIKFNKTGTPKWCTGYKLTGTKYYPEQENG